MAFYGQACMRLELGVELKPFKLKLYGETITTYSLMVRALVYETRDDGSNPSW